MCCHFGVGERECSFMKGDIGEPSAVEFAYVYCIKTLARNKGFRYINNRGLDVEGVWGV